MKVKDIQPRHAANVTPEIKEAWKEANPRGVWELNIDTDDEAGEIDKTDERGRVTKVMSYIQKTGYVRKPTRSEISAAMTIKNDALKQAEELLRDCWLGGDEELLDDEDYFQAAVVLFSELMEVRKGELKKL